jgi:hypothetical protein
MIRPVERFRVDKPRPAEKAAGCQCGRFRSGEPESAMVRIGAVVCWLLSVGLAGYAAWQVTGLWLEP